MFINKLNQYYSLLEITDQFLEIFHDLYGFYFDVQEAIGLLHDRQQQRKIHGVPGITYADSAPDEDFNIMHDASIDEIISRNKPEGININKLRGYILIMISEYWNEKIRESIAIVLGCKKKDEVKLDIMGDITKIRNDLLHNRGKSKNSAHGIIINFPLGDEIQISKDLFEIIRIEIFEHINKLFLDEFGHLGYDNYSFNQEAYKKYSSVKHIVLRDEKNKNTESGKS